jgi:CRP-like cAMP-binding protein
MQPQLTDATRDDVTDALVAKLRARDSVSAEEEQVLRRAIREVRDVPAAKVIVLHGRDLEDSILLADGIVCRYKDLANGERQIQELHVAGDFVDLHGFLLKRLDHDVATVSPCRLVIMPHDAIRRITEDHPHLARMLWFSTLLDAAIQRETILSVGRRGALPRIAHLICELALRLEVVGLGDRSGYKLPMTQADLADATGLTPVHVNRMLRQLRDQQMMTFRHGEVEIRDWPRLAAVAEFDGLYLHLDRQPR